MAATGRQRDDNDRVGDTETGHERAHTHTHTFTHTHERARGEKEEKGRARDSRVA